MRFIRRVSVGLIVLAPRPEIYDGDEGIPCMPDNLLFGKPELPFVGTLGDLDAIEGVRGWSVLLFPL